MKRLWLSLALAAAWPASAWSLACAPAETAFAALRDAHGEVPRYEWTDGAGNRIVVLVSPEGTVSVLAIPADNHAIACLLATGADFRAAASQPGRGA